ncbi:MAG: hypothetical protein WCT05_01685 [Lentisphaeria bacterium]
MNKEISRYCQKTVFLRFLKIILCCLSGVSLLSGILSAKTIEYTFDQPENYPSWKPSGTDILFTHDATKGHKTPGVRCIIFNGKGEKSESGVFTDFLPYEENYQYTVSVFVKTEGLHDDDNIGLSFQPRNEKKGEIANSTLPAKLASSVKKVGVCREWIELIMVFRTPKKHSDYEKVRYLLLTSGGSSKNTGVLYFDDLKISMEPVAEIKPKTAMPDGRTFELSFDQPTDRADFAMAEDLPLEKFDWLRVPGYNGKKAFRQTTSGKTLSYAAVGNADPRYGTALIWFKADNFEPYNPEHRGWDIRPITLFSIHFADKEHHRATLHMMLYRGADAAGFRLNYDNSGFPKGFASYPSVLVPLAKAGYGEWHQFACIWDDGDLSIYMDGEFYGRSFMKTSKRDELHKLNADDLLSSITLRGKPTEQSFSRNEISDVDDFVIYNRVLSPAEIKHLYHQTITPKNIAPEQCLFVQFGGAKNAEGLEAVEMNLDFTVIRNLWWNDKLPRKIRYEIRLKEELVKAGEFEVAADPVIKKMLTGLNASGKYAVKLVFPGQNDIPVEMLEYYEKPDTTWAGNQIGREDSTPEPWTPPVLEENRNLVKIWNREYDFESGGPFPSKILTGGKNLLTRAPVLEIENASGLLYPLGQITSRNVGNSFVTLTGTLTASDFSADFSSTVEFDGFIKTELCIHNAPGLLRMRLSWQVAPEFSHFLLLPKPDSSDAEQLDFPYFSGEARILYLAAEQGGFCWMPTGGMNWVYQPGEKVWHVNKKDGKCSLDVITQPVEMPKNTQYTFCFTVTPTRPLMQDFRTWRFIGGSNREKGDASLHATGFSCSGNLRVSESGFQKWKAKLAPRCLNAYAASSFLRSDNPEAVWFRDQWLTYGYYYSNGQTLALPSCINTSKADFLVYNTKMSLEDPAFKYIDGYYFDCCGLGICPNRRHGCMKRDSFGREVMSTNLLALRDYLKRIIRLLHSKERRLGAHGQYAFIPGLHGLCDYWLTGEEVRMTAIREGVEIYCDQSKVTDFHLRSNSSRGIFGGVEPCVLIYGKDNSYQRQIPAITRLLAEDIKVIGWFGKDGYERMDKVWDTFKKYDADKAQCFRYYEQNRIQSSNSGVKVTWYACSENRVLLIAANFNAENQQTTIDFTPLCKDDFMAVDEISGENTTILQGRLELKVPPQDFRMIAFTLP